MLFDIDLQIQHIKQQRNQAQLIQALETCKFDKQQDIVNLQIQLELLKARNRNRRHEVGITSEGRGSLVVGKSHSMA